MAGCLDRYVCEVALKVGNAIVAIAGLFLLGCGLYLQFGGVNATDNLLEFVKLGDMKAFRILASFPIWVAVFGGVVFILALVCFLCTGSKISKPFYCCYSTFLIFVAVAIAFVVIVLRLAANTIESNHFQEVELLGYDFTDKFQLLWMKGVIEDTESICQLQEVVECSGFYNYQCQVPPSNFTQEEVLTHCPAQHKIYFTTSSLTTNIDNATLAEVDEKAGWSVSNCLEDEREFVSMGCLSTLAELLYRMGNALFIPGLIIAGYLLVLSLIASYLTCCSLCCV
mmetsp:Transcript_6762/g.17222  ORF Transcript_6762/g.17222 Transcript_6762/m.17222 type:complete len:283 (+) Transcript_6762:234-1082(+)